LTVAKLGASLTSGEAAGPVQVPTRPTRYDAEYDGTGPDRDRSALWRVRENGSVHSASGVQAALGVCFGSRRPEVRILSPRLGTQEPPSRKRRGLRSGKEGCGGRLQGARSPERAAGTRRERVRRAEPARALRADRPEAGRRNPGPEEDRPCADAPQGGCPPASAPSELATTRGPTQSISDGRRYRVAQAGGKPPQLQSVRWSQVSSIAMSSQASSCGSSQ